MEPSAQAALSPTSTELNRTANSTLFVVIEDKVDWEAYYPSQNVLTFEEYLKQPQDQSSRHQVINLCRDYSYLGKGYYCSLLAEARGHKVLPSLKSVSVLNQPQIVSLPLPDLEEQLNRSMSSRDGDSFSLEIYFGMCADEAFEELARRLFEIVGVPIMRARFIKSSRWVIDGVEAIPICDLEAEQEDLFAKGLEHFSRKVWREPRSPRSYRYEMAILHDPEDKMPPSNAKALKNIIAMGRKLGVDVDMITKHDYARLAEYDALFIRETTAVTNHTYTFARRAEFEGMVVMDDPTSILRCTNKVFMRDVMHKAGVGAPTSHLLSREDFGVACEKAANLGFPVVLKIPDGSFSIGVWKAKDDKDLAEKLAKLFEKSHLILAQEYLYTEYDWRIGVLGGEPLFACKYFMARDHWQIYKHESNGKFDVGRFATMSIREVPAAVLRTAVKAASLIGDGLYGVDIKQVGDRVCVIEVNDNPNIDAGVEDQYLGEDLYRRLMDEFIRRLEAKRMKY